MSKIKVCIDAGHGGLNANGVRDPGAVNRRTGRQERDDTLRMAIAVNSELTKLNFATAMTRTARDLPAGLDRAVFSNNENCNVFLCIHLNGFDDESANGLETWTPQNTDSTETQLAQVLQRRLVSASGMRDRGVKRDNAGNYPLIARVKADAVLIEYGFVTNAGDNLLFDRNLQTMAKATAEAVQEVYGEQSGGTAPVIIYRVQAGAFAQKANADKFAAELRSKGLDTFISVSNAMYRVQVGAFSVKANADSMLERLRKMGYTDVFIAN